MSGSSSKSIIFFVAEDWYFCSHRIDLAKAAKLAGYDVYVVTRVSSRGAEIEEAGLTLVPINISRKSLNPIRELRVTWELIRIYQSIHPDVVHHVSLKPVIYGSIAARITRVNRVVNALAGLGLVFSSNRFAVQVIRPLVRVILRVLLNQKQVVTILQNPDDVEVMVSEVRVDRSNVRLIMGSGVDTEKFQFVPESDEMPVVLLASRMLWDKGVAEFVDAAARVNAKSQVARFVLAGEGDSDNPQSISDSQLTEWVAHRGIEWLGHCENMPELLARSHIVCLPSFYGEGVPKILIEAASCGRPIITTNTPGCREIVQDGLNGVLVPVRNSTALVSAIEKLLSSPRLRGELGKNGRELVIKRFSVSEVNAATLAVYESVAT